MLGRPIASRTQPASKNVQEVAGLPRRDGANAWLVRWCPAASKLSRRFSPVLMGWMEMSILRKSSPRLLALATSPLLRHELQPCRQLKTLLRQPRQPATWVSTALSFSTTASAEGMDDLAAKKCVPCSSKDIWALSEHSAKELLEKSELGIHGWDLVSENGSLKLQRSWKTKNFMKALEFFQRVAEIAEAEGHHPDLHLLGWNNVKIDLWTHSVGGLTENDFILAAKINTLHVENLLRRKPSTVDPSG